MKKNKKNILVTGCAGFIGMHLCKKLLEKGYKVIGLDNLNDYYDVSLKKRDYQFWKNQKISNLKKLIFQINLV